MAGAETRVVGSEAEILVCLLGSRGDVLPALAVLDSLLARWNLRVTIITHKEQYSLLPSKLQSSATFYGIDLPSVQWDHEDAHPMIRAEEQLHLTACLTAAKLPSHKLTAVITNLFCLEGWLLAQHVGVPCVIIHPNKPPITESARDAVLQSYLIEINQNISSDEYDDLKEWFWPTLCDSYDSFKDYLESDYQVTRDGDKMGSVPVLVILTTYKIASTSSPLRCHMVGYISPALSDRTVPDNILLPPVSKHSYAIVIDFGSMSGYALKECNQSFFNAVLMIAAQDLNKFVFIIITHELRSNRHNRSNCSNIYWINGEVSHAWLFQQYDNLAMIHHGGVGTCQACMMAGIPQGKVVL